MRHLLQPRTLYWAILAAAGSTLACWPRLALWNNKQLPLPYLLFTIFICCIVLWGFVFAWHTPYAGRPILTTKISPKLFSATSALAIVLAGVSRFWLDPKMSALFPEDYPADLTHWIADVLMAFGLWQLFLVFAPCDWLMRLCKNQNVAMVLTAVFSVSVTALKYQPHSGAISPPIFAGLLAGRFVGGLLAVFFYLRGGMALAWWWTLIFEVRLLPEVLPDGH